MHLIALLGLLSRSMSVELDCRRDVNAPEFIIAGVPKVTAGDGGGAASPVS